MFHQTKLKLTAWYVLIIMLISVMFSVGIYRILGVELDRMSKQRRMRFEQVETDWRIPGRLRNYLLEKLDPEVIDEAKKRLAYQLLLINGGILVSASLAGYFLAGRTLKPIQQMVSDQKRFIADASHELKTPLTSLRTEIEVGLNDKHLSLRESRNLLKSNLEEVVKLQNLSEKLLLLSRNGEYYSIKFTAFSITDSINDALSKLNGQIKNKKIQIKKDIKNFKINGDKDKITEMLVILLDNAIKFSNDGGVIYINISEKQKKAEIKIRDMGEGIAKKDLPHIFDRFYRSDTSRTKGYKSGFGLGLSIALKIIKTHKGSINVKSQLNKGSEFVVKLPL